jgi:cyclopropane-fatty-acyl-phospholipid synthase
MLGPLKVLFERAVNVGNLSVIDGHGRQHRFGDGTGAEVVVRLRDPATERALFLDPSLTIAEAYMDGRLVLEAGTIYEFLEIVMRDTQHGVPSWFLRFHDGVRYAMRRFQQFNPAGRAGRNVKHHYDIDQFIYDLFLDDSRQYSCAYFAPGDTLEQAQQGKMRHIAAKLDLKPGLRVLDIGSGWGGLANYLASIRAVDVLGVTLSDAQLEGSRQRAWAKGLDRKVRFEKKDYRRLDTEFDRIVSVGMFEHVGVNHYSSYFRKVRDLLADDGVALIHTIGRTDGPGYTNPFIAKYIFPGGYFPALSEMLPVIEKSGLIVSDVEVLRLHYAETLKAWRERFMANRTAASEHMGEEFCRMWEFYLAGSELGFRYQGLVVFQIQLIKQIDALPIVRDYMTDEENRLRTLDRRPEQRQRSA